MKSIAYDILAGLLLLVVGFGIGWHAKGVSVAAGQLRTSQAETQAVITGVTKQATEQQAAALVEQTRTVALITAQNLIHSNTDSIQAEIDRAQFIVPPPVIALGQITITSACPDDPVGSDEFVRLYDAAAQDADPAVAASAGTR